MGCRVIAVVCLVGAATATLDCARPHDDSSLRVLVEAVGARRLLEPRLTGGFAYARCAPPLAPAEVVSGTPPTIPMRKCSEPLRPGSPDWSELAKAATAIHRMRSREPRGRRLVAAAVLGLLSNTSLGAERAVKSLEAAADENRGDVQTLSDLAAAYFVRAGYRQEPADLIRALEAVEQALAANPLLPEALFNRALILERLRLRGRATDAWQEVRSREQGSGWSAEADSHLATLAHLPATDFGNGERAAVRAAALRANETEVLRLVTLSPQAAREHAMNDLLAEWGKRYLDSDPAAAAESLNTARCIGASLRALHGDETVASAVAAIERVTSSPSDRATSRALAHAHVVYPVASRLAHELALEKARPQLIEANNAFTLTSSPLTWWTTAALGGIELDAGHHADGIRLFSSVAERADPLAYPAVQGRVHWGLAMIRGRQGRFSESLAGFELAGEFFLRALEIRNQASIDSLIGEMRNFLGQSDAAWSHRYRALTVHSNYQASRQLDNLLFEGANALLGEGKPGAAVDFADEGVGVGMRSGQASMVAEDLIQRSRIHAALGQADAALADLTTARVWSAREKSNTTRERVRPDIDLMEGEMRLAREPRPAIRLLTAAIETYAAQNRSIDVDRAILSRARALVAGGEVTAAASQLAEAIDLFSTHRATITDRELRLTYSDTAQGLFDEMIELQAGPLHQPGQAFEYSERARVVPTLQAPQSAIEAVVPASVLRGSSATVGVMPSLKLSEIPEGVAFVEYSVTPNRLFTWVVYHGGITASSHPIKAEELDREVSAFVSAVRGGDERRTDAASAVLYTSLIPPGFSLLPFGTRLVFVPDKSINAVPFAALKRPNTGRYLIEDWSLTVAPSLAFYLSALKRGGTAGSRRGWSALLVGNPALDARLFPQLADLPGAAAETDEVRALYKNSVVLFGRAADRSRILAEIDRHEVYAFAGHAVDNPRAPADSYLVLSPSQARTINDGVLFAHEVSGLHFNHLRLVVLSACHTAATSSSRVAGLTGLTRPFLDAGAQAVLGTLWEIDDRTANRLLPEFHRRFAGGLDTTSALRAAQLAMLRGNQASLRSPAHWAAFQMVGEVR